MTNKLISLLVIILITSCSNRYYKGYHIYDHNEVAGNAREWEVGTAFEEYESLNSGRSRSKKVFIHQGKNVWEFTDMNVNIKKNKLSGRFAPVDSLEYQKYLYFVTREFEKNRMKNYSDERYAANQAHITIYDSIAFHRDTINEIHFSDVADIKDYRHFQGKERGVKIASTLVPIAAGVTVWLIVLAVLVGAF